MNDLAKFFKYALLFITAWAYPVLLVVLAIHMPKLFPSVLIALILTVAWYTRRSNRTKESATEETLPHADK